MCIYQSLWKWLTSGTTNTPSFGWFVDIEHKMLKQVFNHMGTVNNKWKNDFNFSHCSFMVSHESFNVSHACVRMVVGLSCLLFSWRCLTPLSTLFELTTSVMIATDYIGSCKSNYHTITTTTAPCWMKPSTISAYHYTHEGVWCASAPSKFLKHILYRI